MAQILQHRRNTTAALSSERGSNGEIIIDTTKKTVVVMDGVTNGGTPLAKESDIPVNVSELINDAGYITSAAVFSGSYNDLTDKPVLFSGAYADLTGKPTLFSGAYADLTGKPDLSLYQLANSEFVGSVSATNDVLLVDGANAKIVGPIETSSATIDILNANNILITSGGTINTLGADIVLGGGNINTVNQINAAQLNSDTIDSTTSNTDDLYANNVYTSTITMGVGGNIYGQGSVIGNFTEIEAVSFKSTRYGGDNDVIYAPNLVTSGLGHSTSLTGGQSNSGTGGSVSIDGGPGAVIGDINIGTQNAGLITIGRPGSTTEVYGTLDISSATVNNISATSITTTEIGSAGGLVVAADLGLVLTGLGIQARADGPLLLSSNNSAVYMTGTSGAGSIAYLDNDGSIIISTTGLTKIEGVDGGEINLGTGTSGDVVFGNGNNTISFTANTIVDFDGTVVTGYLPTTIASGLSVPGTAVVATENEIQFNFSTTGTMASIGRTAITLGNNTLGGDDTEHVVLNAVTRVQLNSPRISFINATVPTSSTGAVGDSEGMIAFDSNYFYYCTDLYDGVTNIWKRIAWLSDTW